MTHNRVVENMDRRKFLQLGVGSVAGAVLLGVWRAGEAQAATYSQIVDNATAGRFSASDQWVSSNYSSQRYGPDYRILETPGSTTTYAKYKIKRPVKGPYTVYARWPSNSGYNAHTRYRIKTSGGWTVREVDQRQNGGVWHSLGTHTLYAGDSQIIEISSYSSGAGYIIADAVKVVQGGTLTTGATGVDVVSFARKQLEDRYEFGASGPDSFDCSGLTQYVYNQAAHNYLPHSAAGQYKYGSKAGSFGRGFLAFYRPPGKPISHVGICTGDGRLIHAVNPKQDVLSSPLSYLTSKTHYGLRVAGIKRLLPPS